MNNGFIENNNYKIIKSENGSSVLTAEITSTSLNLFGVAHGGYIFGLADTAAGAAAMSNGRHAMTVSADIDYLHSAKGNSLKAEANCIKDGKTISVYEVSIYDDAKLVAKGSFTYFYLD